MTQPAEAAGTAVPPGRRRRARSLRRTSRWALGGLVVVLALCVLGGVRGVVGLSSSREELSDHLDPAATAAASLRASALSQQNAVRGFALSGEPSFLAPWEQGKVEAASHLADLRALLEDRPVIGGHIDDVEAALTTWQDESGQALVDTRQSAADLAPLVLVSRDNFERVRQALDVLGDDIDAERAVARRELEEAGDRLVRTLVFATMALAASVVGLWVAVRRLALDPLSLIVDDTRRVAGGDLDHVMHAGGPAEFVELSRSIDQVRVALVEQLRAGEAREADLARSNTELEQFAYVASHDLQEPLRKVASFCQMLERRYKGQLDERADQYISFAVDGAKRMQDLINDLLAFSRVGRTTEGFAVVDLDDIVDRALRNLSVGIAEAGATVRRDPLPTVEGDRSLLVALFQNLVGNAVKFRGHDAPLIHIRAAPRGEHVEISVSDNGIGIPAEYRDRIFVIFQRLHGRDEYAGTGIGLALCRKIVEFHGGRIEVAAEHEGPGATIRFTLQVSHGATPAAAAIDTQELVNP